MVDPWRYSSNAIVTFRIFSMSSVSSSSSSAASASAPTNARDFIELNKRRNANHVRLALDACRSLHRASKRGHVRTSRERHRSASFAHSLNSSRNDVCSAADSSQICALARRSSMPVNPDFTGPSRGSASMRSQICVSCVNSGCSGHSSRSFVNRRRIVATGGTRSAISPGHPPTVSSASSASAAASSSNSARVRIDVCFADSASSRGDEESASTESAGFETAECSSATRRECPKREA